MSASEGGNGMNRADLLQRVELIETMIAEGRQVTGRYGWIFVAWGLIYIVATLWTMLLPKANWAWPVCIVLGVVLIKIGKTRQRRAGGSGENPRSRSIEAVWTAMGMAITLYVFGAVASHHVMSPAYVAAILFFLGLANAASAIILRWKMQGLVAAIWWMGGFASFFAGPREAVAIFLTATFFGLILFGLYAMMQERQRAKFEVSLLRHNV